MEHLRSGEVILPAPLKYLDLMIRTNMVVVSLSLIYSTMCAETEEEILDEVAHASVDYTSDPWPNISDSAKDLVQKMLLKDPKKRLTVHEALRESSPVIYMRNWTQELYINFHLLQAILG